jgi:uncharacterized membrane protein YhaH (DUF805 family)
MRYYISRVRRGGFITSVLFLLFVLVLLVELNAPLLLISICVYFIFAWMILLYIGRLHDMGCSGWWTILAMPTGIGILLMIFWPSQNETNKYGEVPSQSLSYLLHFWWPKKQSA